MLSVIEPPVTPIASYFVISRLVEVSYIHFFFHESVTRLLPGVSLFILPSPLHTFTSGLLHLSILHISPVFLLNRMVPVLTCCLLCYSFCNHPYCSLGPIRQLISLIFYCAQGLTEFISRILPFLYLPI